MRRRLRRLHLLYWIVLTPALLWLIAYALTRQPIDAVDADAPPVIFDAREGR